MRTHRVQWTSTGPWAAVLAILLSASAGATPDDPRFTEAVYYGGTSLGSATGFGFAPDGSRRLFVTRKTGAVRIILDGALLPTPFHTFTPFTNSECGVIGMAFDPGYVTNRFVYFLVTISSSEQQIIRLRDANNVGVEPTVIIPGLPTAGVNHNGGGLGFGRDGRLYWSIGDNGSVRRGVDADLSSLAAKVGRANPDGSVPNDNPFFDGTGPNNDFIWARGFRNPFTLTFHPVTGQLWLNVVGTSYEQVFALEAGDHGGWDDYEINQPTGYVRPVIKYKTGGSDVRTVTSASRTGGVTTFTTSGPHLFVRGEKITLAGVSDTTFNGDVYVAEVPSPTTFTAAQPGADATSSGGSATTLEGGRSLSGGSFYDSTAWPEELRGSFFFGDYVAAEVYRAQLDSQFRVTRVDRFSSGIESYIDATTGPDGALYYLEHQDGRIHRVTFNAPSAGIALSAQNVRFPEGTASTVSVRLNTDPGGPVTVTVARRDGDTDLAVSAGASLQFTSANHATPQTVTLTSTVDGDADDDLATFELTAPGLSAVTFQATATDAQAQQLEVSSAFLELAEGESTTLRVRLQARPSSEVTVNLTVSGDPDVTLSPATLTFTSGDYATFQTVTVSAANDSDNLDDSAELQVTASGVTARSVSVAVFDKDPAAPRIVPPGPLFGVVNAPFTLPLQVVGNPAPTCALSGQPAGMSIDAGTCVISWTPAAVGTFTATVNATNGTTPDGTASLSIEVREDAPPTCSISRPTAGATLGGATEEFFGDGNDDVNAVKADFFVGDTLGYTDTVGAGAAGHFHYGGSHNLFDTTAYPDGEHALRMVVTDSAGHTCEASVVVVIDNGTAQPDSCGCSATSGSGAVGLFLLALLRGRRKRSS